MTCHVREGDTVTLRDFGKEIHASVRITRCKPYGILLFYIRLDEVVQVLGKESGDVCLRNDSS